jgi:hypothetical protein
MPKREPKKKPHPKAAKLTMPDKSPAPEALRAWAAISDCYPDSDQAIATPQGVVIAKPMKKILLYVCYESIADELDCDDETLEYVKELARDFAEEMPGYGVILEPEQHPDRVLWIPPSRAERDKREPMVIWYEDDAFERREPFKSWSRGGSA